MTRPETFYQKITLTANFQVLDFSFECDAILLVFPGALGDITMSWTGETGTNDGDLVPDDVWVAFDGINKSKIALKSTASDEIRVWAWMRSKS